MVSAQRELREETGIEASDLAPVLLHMELSNSVSDELAYVFLATGLSFGESAAGGDGGLALRKLPLVQRQSRWRWTAASRTR